MQLKKCQSNLNAFYSLSASDKETLTSIFEREVEQCRDQLILVFTTKMLVFEANMEDDSISVQLKKKNKASAVLGIIKESSPFRRFAGKSFGWGWVTVNQQGYCDGALLSFDGIQPDIHINIVASSILVNELRTVRSLLTSSEK